MICQFVKNFVCIVTFSLYITYTYGTQADAWLKKDKNLENQKGYMDPSNIFVHPFSPRGFLTFLVTVVHGAPWPHNGQQIFLSFLLAEFLFFGWLF